MKYFLLAFLWLFLTTLICTAIGKFKKMETIPYEQRFKVNTKLTDFFKDHKNNIYIWKTLTRNKYNLLILCCTILISYAAIAYIWFAGAAYYIYYLMHFHLVYDKKQPYVIDVREYTAKADPAFFDCLKTIHKISKSAAFFRFYKTVEFFYIKKNPLNLSSLAQTVLITALLGYNYWCLCVVIDIAITICNNIHEAHLFFCVKDLISNRLLRKYGLSADFIKKSRIYWFDGRWHLNPPKLLPFKVYTAVTQTADGWHTKHTAFAHVEEGDSLANSFIFTKKLVFGGEGIKLYNFNTKIKQQFLQTNGLCDKRQLIELTMKTPTLENCRIDSEDASADVYTLAIIHTLYGNKTFIEQNGQIEILNENKGLLILNNKLSQYKFSDNTRRVFDYFFEEQQKNKIVFDAIYAQLSSQQVNFNDYKEYWPTLGLENPLLENPQVFDPY